MYIEISTNGWGLSVDINCEAVSHIGILTISRWVGLDEPDNPENDAEEDGADGQDKATSHPHLACAHHRHLLLQSRQSISGQIMQWWNYLLAIHLNNSLITPAQPFLALQSQIVRISFLKCRSKAAPKHFADSDLNRNQFCSRTRAVDCRWR